MVTLDDAITIQQRLHGLVETYALTVKQNKPAGSIMQNLKRQVPTLAAKLKGQFGMISDLVTSVNMQMTRGSSEQQRVRLMRDGMAAIKAQLDIAVAQTIARHKLVEEKPAEGTPAEDTPV